MGDIVRTLTPEELQQIQEDAQAIALAATSTVQAGQFVFFAAFDGTNNDRTNPALSDDPQSTNVGQLAYQAEASSDANLIARYYPGVGTSNTSLLSSWFPPAVTQQIVNTANDAYNEFAYQAATWLDANQGGSITTAITGFSRGGPTAVVFAQLLNEKGLIDPRDGSVLIPPGQVDVSAMLLLDPVSTGFSGNLGIPPNVNPDNIVVVQALDEYRVLYKGDDFSSDPRVRVVDFYGNHGDVGGFYDQGLGALSLQGATGFFRGAGIIIGDVPPERQFNPDLAAIHTEGVDSYGNRIWDEYGSRGSRLLRAIGVQQPTQILDNGFYHSSTTLNDAGQLTMTVERDVSGHRVVVEFTENEWGDLAATRVLSVDGQIPVDSEAFANALNAQGYGGWDFADGLAPSGGAELGNLYTAFNPMQPDGSQTLANVLQNGTLIDALSLIRAIQAGEPLPVVASGLRFAADINNRTDLTLNGASNIAAGALSLLSLQDALDRGDTLATISAGAQALSFGAQAFSDFALDNAFDAFDAGTIDLAAESAALESGALAQTTGKALPYLNLVNSLENGDEIGAGISALQIANMTGLMAVPGINVIAIAYTVFSLVSGLFGDDDSGQPPEPWGTASAAWSGTTIVANTAGEHGGQATAADTYNSFLDYLNQLADDQQASNPANAIGVIANRLPSISYRYYSGFQLTDIDPLTGVQRYPEVKYDLTGHPYNAPPGSEQGSQSLSERFIRVALARGAIAPMWEVETAALQTLAGDPQAGLTEEERAGRNGQLAAPLSGDTQIFRPAALDLDGDGIETTGVSRTVAFDVDDSGFFKNTAWLGNNDGFLFLDRNLNGQIDSGRELFSNSTVGLDARGLAGMRWMDSNYDDRLTDADPVWEELKVWQDADSDGEADIGEVNGLTALGIAALDYALGQFEQNGEIKQLASPDLAADTEGARTHVVPEGIIVETSQGHISILVTRITGLVEANGDIVTSYEDIESIISTADLMVNDSLGGYLANDLTITGISNFTHGTGFLDSNGFVHFNPETNYIGPASFDYTIQAPNGLTDTATVSLDLLNINDPPTVTLDQHSGSLYGYASSKFIFRPPYPYIYIEPTNPQFSPYFGRDFSKADDPNATADDFAERYHDVILGYTDPDGPNIGNLVPSDIDDPNGQFFYEVIAQPQKGEARIDSNGRFEYINWTGPNQPGIHWDGSFYAPDYPFVLSPNGLEEGAWLPSQPATEIDPFTIRITDPHGASTTITVNAIHTGNYSPTLGTYPDNGGGGGGKPIAIDLGNNGFSFTDVNDSNIFYDINGDGFRHRTAWPTADDGLLAYDLDGNGLIEKQGEISFTSYLPGAQTDLEGLNAFDTNHDGVLSSADEKWAKFGVWQDADQDGVTDSGEFKTLSELGIQSMALTSDNQFAVVNGQTVHGVGTITKTDGSTLDFADVTLRYTDDVLIQNPDGTTQVVIREPFSPSGEELLGTEDNDLILGKTGNNLVYAYGGDDVVFEDGGNDFIDGAAGNDTIYSGADNDIVLGGDGNDVVFAGNGNDLVLGGDGNDALLAEGGNDVVFGGDGNDLVSGGFGNDVLSGDQGNDQIYGESGNDALFGMAGDDELGGMDGHDLLNGGDGNDLLDGGEGIDQMTGGTGDDTYVVDNVADTITENQGEGTDTIRASLDYTLGAHLENLTLTGMENLNGTGNALDNVLSGNAGANTLTGGAGNDILNGGAGADVLDGGEGDDAYHYYLGAGSDTIFDTSGNDYLVLGGGIFLGALHTTLVGDDLVIGSGTDTYLTIAGWSSGTIESFIFADGSVYSADFMEAWGHAPVLQASLPDLAGDEDSYFSHDLAGTFSDADGNNTLTYSAVLQDGSTLPDWLNLDDVTGLLSGTPGNFDVGSLSLRVTATDSVGRSVSDTFSLVINNVNDVPIVANSLANQAVDEDTLFSLSLTDVFGDDDLIHDDSLTLSAGLADGSALPNWLTFDATTGTFSGTPDNGQVGSYDIQVTATDLAGTSASDVFTLTVNNVNDIPIVANSIVDQATDEDSLYTFSLANVFTDDDLIHGDSLTLSAVRADGSALPDWLTFDAVTGTFSGTPDNGDVGSYEVRVTATDLAGTRASDVFTLTVNNINDNPVLANALGDLTTDEDAPFGFTVPSSTFFDDDFIHGDTLTLSATLIDGSVLPDWLTFDPNTGTFTGTPDNGDVGSYEVRVTATDLAGTSVSDDLVLTVHNTNDAPILANALTDQTATEGTAFSYMLPEDTFHDDDAIHGDVLAYEATLSDGSALPSWLSFDTSTQTFIGTAATDSILLGTDGDDVLVDTDTGIAGTWDIQITATDTAGTSASDTFTLTLQGIAGSDTLNGGKGNDVLNGGGGNDTYLYNPGDGLDMLTDREGQDTVSLGTGFTFDNTVIRTEGNTAHLRFLDDDGCETAEGMDITLNGDGTSPIESFTFQDGTSYTLADLLIITQTWYGTKKADTLIGDRNDDTIYAGKGGDKVYGRNGNDTLYGEKGDDKLYGEGGNDTLYGGKGKDYLDGGAGNDILDGGEGHNTLIGGKGDDTLILGKDSENDILFNTGDGWDTLKTNTKDDGHDNDIHFGDGITQDNLWFSRTGDNLQINILGTNDGMTIEGWYANKHKPIEEIQTANGDELEAKQVALLVQAMAAFTPTLGSGTPLPTEMPNELQAVLAGAWEAGN